MNERGSAQKGVIAGSILVVIGLVLLLERFGVLRFDLMDHFWPAVIALFGANLVFSDRGTNGRAFGVLLLIYATVQELRHFDLIHFRMRDIWPVYLIALGGFLLYRALRPEPIGRREGADFDESRLSEFAIFGGGEIKVSSRNFEGGTLMAMFGGYDVDFTNTQLASPAVIQADAIFGGVTLKVPPHWRVTARGTAIFGGFSNEALPPAESDQPEQHLVVKGVALFGGVEISNPKR